MKEAIPTISRARRWRTTISAASSTPLSISRDGVIQKTKEQAEKDHENDHWDGETTE